MIHAELNRPAGAETQVRHAVIVHGYGATPTDHWFQNVAGELGNRGVETTVPPMPNPTAPDPDSWADALAKHLRERCIPPGKLHKVALIGHSLGSLTILRLLTTLRPGWTLGRLVLVAGFAGRLPHLPELDGFATLSTVEVTRLAAHVSQVSVIRSDNDVIVPGEHTDPLARLLGTRSKVVAGQGHFLHDDGVTTLPQAVSAVLETPLPINVQRRVPAGW